MVPSSIPSPDPSQSQWSLGPFTIHAYALCILIGVAACLWLTERRWVARGGRPGTVSDIAVWAIPFGLVGARLYHVVSSWNLYLGEGRRPIEALYIWNGGLGIWGAIALGALGAYIGARRSGTDFRAFADAAAPGILLAQAIGRWGNWFNQELFGGPSDAPWALEIDRAYRPAEYLDQTTFVPTFLYESVWSLIGVAVLLWADRRFRLGHGRIFALYVAWYCVGRAVIEAMRVDEAFQVGPFRLNVWTALLLLVAALVYLWRTRRLGREERVQSPPDEPDADADADAAADADADADAEPGAGPGTEHEEDDLSVRDDAVASPGTDSPSETPGDAPAEERRDP